MSKKSFDSIMSEITAGLSGDPAQDYEYLEQKMNEYKNHKYGTEIIRACGRIVYDITSDDKKEELSSIIEKYNMGFEASLEEIKFKISQKEFKAALDLTESMIEKYEGLKLYEDDKVSEYHNFDEPIQNLLYETIFKPDKTVREASINYAAMYFIYGSILIDLKRYDDAHRALQTALKWNPVSCGFAFEDTETFKCRGLFEKFFESTNKIHKFIVYPQDLARYYRNLGYYYTEKNDYHTAACCYFFSLNFDKSNTAMSELYYLSTKAGKMFEPDGDEICRCLEEKNIPFGPDKDVISMAYTYGTMCYKDNLYPAAEYFLNICKAYFDDEDLDSMLEDIQNSGN